MTSAIKPGCVMVMMFSAMLTDAFQDCEAGFHIKYRFDGKLFNLKRLQVKSKVQTNMLDKLLCADDMAENSKTETKMQGAIDRQYRESRTANQPLL